MCLSSICVTYFFMPFADLFYWFFVVFFLICRTYLETWKTLLCKFSICYKYFLLFESFIFNVFSVFLYKQKLFCPQKLLFVKYFIHHTWFHSDTPMWPEFMTKVINSNSIKFWKYFKVFFFTFKILTQLELIFCKWR